MKFEFTSRFRNRKQYPSCGRFVVESAQGANTRFNSIDPVCLSAPMFSWVPNFSANGNILTFSANNVNTVEIIILFGALPLQATVDNFMTGCILTSASLNLNVLESYLIAPLTVRVTVSGNWPLTIGQAVNVADYTSFSPLNVRAPLTFDFGKYRYLYNERLNQFLTIKEVNAKTRNFSFYETTAVGWLTTDNLNIRSEIPSYVVQVVGATSTTLVLNNPVANTNDWVRLRLANYSTQPISDSWSRQIYQIDALGTTINFFPPINVLPAVGSIVEILPFSFDNAVPVENFEIPKSSFFEVSLEALIIPNVDIVNGDLKSIPYIGVELKNEKSRQTYRHFINSNNPLTPECCWIAKVDAYSLTHKELKFIVCNTEQKYQIMEMNINLPFEIILRLPNGKIFEPLLPDNSSPQQSWEELNFTAVFEMKPIQIGTSKFN
jgi:hypothetical protein